MFFYIFHKINQNIKQKDELEGTVNTRTLIMGGICYILMSAFLSTPNNPLNFYRHYLWYFLVLDFCVMAVHYKLYFGRTILKELKPYEDDKYNEEIHRYKKKNNKEINKKVIQENVKSTEKVIQEKVIQENVSLKSTEKVIQENVSLKSTEKVIQEKSSLKSTEKV